MEDPTDVIIELGKTAIFRSESAPLQGEIIKDAYVQGRNDVTRYLHPPIP